MLMPLHRVSAGVQFLCTARQALCRDQGLCHHTQKFRSVQNIPVPTESTAPVATGGSVRMDGLDPLVLPPLCMFGWEPSPQEVGHFFKQEQCSAQKALPGPTRSYQATPGPTRRRQVPLGPTRPHQETPGPTRKHEVPPGPTRQHQVPPGPMRPHKVTR